MVKAPVAGRVKTRLGRDIGMTNAAWWYRHQTARLLRRLRDPRWHIVLAVAKAPNQPDPPIWPKELQRMDQGTGDLGQRMKRLLARFQTTPALSLDLISRRLKSVILPRRLNVCPKTNLCLGHQPMEVFGWSVRHGVRRFQTQYSQIVDGRLNSL